VCCNASISRIDDYPIKHHFDPTVAHIQLFPSHSATSGLAPVLNSGLAPSHRSSLTAYTSEVSGNNTTSNVLARCTSNGAVRMYKEATLYRSNSPAARFNIELAA
jgi:hypothetical protein